MIHMISRNSWVKDLEEATVYNYKSAVKKITENTNTKRKVVNEN